MIKVIRVRFVAVAAFLLVPLSVQAEPAATVTPFPEPVTGQASDSWQFRGGPYFWAAGLKGTVGQFGLPAAKLRSDFSDILKELDFSFMGMLEGKRGPYRVFSDIAYTKVSMRDSVSKGPLTQSIGVKSQTFSGLLGGGYGLVDQERTTLDVMAGVRVWSVRTQVSFDGGLLNGVSRRDSATWADAVVGVRGQYRFTDNFYLTGWGSIGAGQAKLDWDTALALGYRTSKSLAIIAGYRMQGVDYSRRGFVFDVIQKGPVLGLTMRF